MYVYMFLYMMQPAHVNTTYTHIMRAACICLRRFVSSCNLSTTDFRPTPSSNISSRCIITACGSIFRQYFAKLGLTSAELSTQYTTPCRVHWRLPGSRSRFRVRACVRARRRCARRFRCLPVHRQYISCLANINFDCFLKPHGCNQ